MANKKHDRLKLWAVVIWLSVWYLAAALLKQEILLASPVSVIIRWAELIRTGDFWQRTLTSCARIMAGLLGGSLLGILLGALASKHAFIRDLFAPLVAVIRAIPVASFIILALVWLDEKSLAWFISLLICFPVFYTNTLSGIQSADEKLLEMAKVFCLSPFKRLKAIYLPALLPYISASVEVAVGLAWKSGIAAEVIAVPRGTIGEKLYYAKIYLMSGDMLAWTLTIVLISGICSRLIKFIVKKWMCAYE